MRAEGGTVLFQGAPVIPVKAPRADVSSGKRPVASLFATRDKLALVMRDNTIVSLKLAGKEVATDAPSGFLVRDVAANSDFYRFESGKCPDLGLKLKAQ